MAAGAGKRMELGGAALRVLPVGAAALFGVTAPAHAQSVTFNPDYGRSGQFLRRFDVAVADRPQPQFDAVPIRLDSFDLLATAAATVEPNDNIYAVENDRKADVITALSASADIASDWSRHGVRAFARGSVIRYLDNSSENVDIYGVGASGRFDVGPRGSTVQVGAQHDRNFVSRLATESTTVTIGQITVDDTRAFIGGTFGERSLRLSGTFDVSRQRFSRNSDFLPLDEFRDRDLYHIRLKGEYALSPSLSGFVRVDANRRDFLASAVDRPDRDSNGVEATVGSSFELAILVRGEVAVGYVQQRFASPVYRDYSGLAYHAQLEYFPTRLVTVTANADRDVRDSSRIGIGAFIANTYSIKADYELLRNLLLTPQVGVGRDSFQGLDLDYSRFSASMTARYTMNRRFVFGAGVNYDSRDAEGTALAREFNVLRGRVQAIYRF